MKGFAKISLSVALIAVIVLSIVVASVAWFTSNPEVDANDVTLNASRTLTVSFGPGDEDTGYRYNGQIGNVPDPVDPTEPSDAPYAYKAGGFTVDLTSLSSDDAHARVKLEFGTVTINTKVENMENISGVLITDLFHITADVYTEADEGGFVKDGDETKRVFRAYDAGSDSGKTRYALAFSNLSVADDGVLKQTVNNVTSDAEFGQSLYEVAFTYTFLPEAAYQVWAAATQESDYQSIYGYELSLGGSGEYIGVVDYTSYKAKYHYGLTRYSKSATADGNGNYTYTEDENGAYVRAITSYVLASTVTKYTSAAGDGEGAANGTYIKVGDSNDYVLFFRYHQVNGFPYSADQYRGERFTFTVACSVEEVIA